MVEMHILQQIIGEMRRDAIPNVRIRGSSSMLDINEWIAERRRFRMTQDWIKITNLIQRVQ